MNAITKTIIFVPSVLFGAMLVILIIEWIAYLLTLTGLFNHKESMIGLLFAILIILSYLMFKEEDN